MLDAITDNLRIVMVETSHPGNIGAAARAMKAMGQRHLYLVKPAIFPSAEVTARAAGADDLLEHAVVCTSFEDAVRDCVLVVGTTARIRRVPWTVERPREGAARIVETAKSGRIAVVFGREDNGLTNEELGLCNTVVQIPTDPGFSSLNVAAAVQIICYEILQAAGAGTVTREDSAPLATAEHMRQLYEHFAACMTEVGFYNPRKPRLLMRRLQRLFNRAQLDQNEINILRGFLSAVQEFVQKLRK
ncbi:MAG: RNA methyltransferase [Gammaproteobacteria bacterium]